MKIDWFPGHMKKALDMMKNELKNVDLIIYVLDARAPKTCINPKFKNSSTALGRLSGSFNVFKNTAR